MPRVLPPTGFLMAPPGPGGRDDGPGRGRPPAVVTLERPTEALERLLAGTRRTGALPVVVREAAEGRADALTPAAAGRLQAAMPASSRQNLGRMMASPDIMDDWYAALAEVGLTPGPTGMPEVADRRLLPTTALARAGALVRYGQMVPPGTLVLLQKGLGALLANETVVRTSRGWIEPTLEGKGRVVETEAGRGRLLMRGDEVTPQDLFDFYNLIFEQALYYRAFLIFLRNRGADVSPLAQVVRELDRLLSQAIAFLLSRRFDESLQNLQEANRLIIEFRRVMTEIAHTVGLDVDPVVPAIFPLEGGGHPAAARVEPPVWPGRDDREPDRPMALPATAPATPAGAGVPVSTRAERIIARMMADGLFQTELDGKSFEIPEPSAEVRAEVARRLARRDFQVRYDEATQTFQVTLTGTRRANLERHR